jgi:hypothetical protein
MHVLLNDELDVVSTAALCAPAESTMLGTPCLESTPVMYVPWEHPTRRHRHCSVGLAMMHQGRLRSGWLGLTVLAGARADGRQGDQRPAVWDDVEERGTVRYLQEWRVLCREHRQRALLRETSSDFSALGTEALAAMRERSCPTDGRAVIVAPGSVPQREAVRARRGDDPRARGFVLPVMTARAIRWPDLADPGRASRIRVGAAR